jgi:hypothetical protein
MPYGRSQKREKMELDIKTAWEQERSIQKEMEYQQLLSEHLEAQPEPRQPRKRWEAVRDQFDSQTHQKWVSAENDLSRYRGLMQEQLYMDMDQRDKGTQVVFMPTDHQIRIKMDTLTANLSTRRPIQHSVKEWQATEHATQREENPINTHRKEIIITYDEHYELEQAGSMMSNANRGTL